MKDPFIAARQNNDKHWAGAPTTKLEDVKHWQKDHQQTLKESKKIGRAIEDYGQTRKGVIDDTDVIESTFHVRYAETDQMGIVHHASYVAWLEEGRSQWMRVHGNSYAQFEKEDLLLVLSELYLRYKQPARYDQRVTIRCWVDRVQSRQIQFNYEVVDAETKAIFAGGYTRLICLNREGKVTKMPDKWQRFFRQGRPAMANVGEHKRID